MGYKPKLHHRRSIRLKGYDYTQPGWYFITICTQDRLYLFGEIKNRVMILNGAGRMAETVWKEIPQYYYGFAIHDFSIMPNHIHGIIQIIQTTVGAGPRACPYRVHPEGQPQGVAPTDTNTDTNMIIDTNMNPSQIGPVITGQLVTPAMTIPDIVHRYKTLTTKRYTDGVKQYGWTPFPGRLWQRNYYEHIIRNEPELNRIREYIANNVRNWKDDNCFDR